jgi:hypothetical protein
MQLRQRVGVVLVVLANGDSDMANPYRHSQEALDGTDGARSRWPRAGGFSYFTAEDRWEWSDAVAEIHGYTPGTVCPTTELVLFA